MKKLLLMLVLACIGLGVQAELKEETRKAVDRIKAEIPYPKYNLGDTLYFPTFDLERCNEFPPGEDCIEVLQVVITDAKLVHGWVDVTLFKEMYLDECSLRWLYQYVKTSIWKPSIDDFSDYYSDDMFFPSIKEAVEHKLQIIKERDERYKALKGKSK